MRHLFLALLADGPRHGYELRSTLEQTFGSMLPTLNTGQIYTTLQRLERDGLVEGHEVPGDTRNKRTYALTDTGRTELQAWIETPVPGTRLKDEFFMKLVVVSLRSADEGRHLIDSQRREYLQSLRDLDDLARTASGDTVAALLVEGAQLHVEADLRWLDLCAQRLLPKERS
ncbi:MAG: PadR family transcriptional regulator [Acidimicrobiales bacterium]